MNQRKLILSAIVVAKNEGSRIADCLKSLSFCSECIVIDNGSSDATVVIATKMGAKIVASKSRYFSELHMLGAKEAKGDWLLYIDADERIDETLKSSIKNITGNFSAYRIQRKNYYLGVPWPKTEYLVRLIRRDALIEWQGALHETAIVKGEVGDLDGLLLHDTHRTLEEMVSKTNQWSKIEAKLRLDADHPKIASWRLLRVFITGFFNTYFKDGGWKVGTVGLIESLYQGFSLFITYAKLWELQQKNNK